MDRKDVEQMLSLYPYIVAENKNLKLECERMDINGIKPITYEFKPKINSKGSVVESEVIDIEKKRGALERQIRLNEIHLDKIDSALTSLNDLEREIIKRVYFKKTRNKDVAQQLFITHIYVSVVKRSALDKLQKILK